MRCLVLVALLLIGCSGNSKPIETVGYRKIIPPEDRDRVGKWVTATVAAANPHSDEEPEDNVYQVEKTALEVYGIATLGMWIRPDNCNFAVFVPYDRLSDRQKKVCDDHKSGKEN